MSPGPIDQVLPEVLEQHRGRIRGLFLRFGIPPADAEDLLQSALLSTVEQWPEIRSAGGWLVGVLEKKCLAYWKRRFRYEEMFASLEAGSAAARASSGSRGVGGIEGAEGIAEVATDLDRERRDLLADLERVCGSLPAVQYKLLVYRFRLGYDIAETARALGLAESSMGNLTRRAVARVRALLD
jgi:DNA-directed RNA polymerase specialized sigma24 family protein